MPSSATANKKKTVDNIEQPVCILSYDDDQSDKSILLIWGKTGVQDYSYGLDFYLVVDCSELQLLSLTYGIFESKSSVSPSYNLEKHSEYFKGIEQNYPSDQTFKYGELYQNIGDDLEEHLLEKKNLKRLHKALKKEKKGLFEKLLEKMPHIRPPEEKPQFIRGGVLSPEVFEKGFTTSANSNDKNEREDEIIDTTSPEVEEIKGVESLPRVSISTTVVNGTRVGELKPRDKVKFRLLGKMVNNLPESKVDKRRNQASVPLEGKIIQIEKKFSLPGDIDGSPEDYKLLILRADEGFAARGYLQKEERVIVHNKKKEKSKNPDLLPDYFRYIIYPLVALLFTLFVLLVIF